MEFGNLSFSTHESCDWSKWTLKQFEETFGVQIKANCKESVEEIAAALGIKMPTKKAKGDALPEITEKGE